MKQLSILIKPASAACNMRCKYCFYADIAQTRDTASYGMMTEDTANAILENIARELTPGDRVTFAFQGGEPTLAGLPFFRHFVDRVTQWDSRVQVQYALQTNGLVLDDEWCGFLKAHNFLVGLSLDILPGEHNDVRIDAKGEGTWKTCLQTMNLLKRHGVEHNVLCTLTDRIARHPREVWKQVCRLDIGYIQFTPCLDSLDATEKGPYALTPKHFASFYKELFPFWFRDLQAGKYRSVKLFDDLVNLLAFGRVTACGMTGQCQNQIIVEADGRVYPCDFYCLDEYCLGNLSQDLLSRLLTSPKTAAFITRPHPRPTICAGCPYTKLCGGNCKRMQSNICCEGSDSYCGYRDLLDSCGRDLSAIARAQRQFRR